VRSKLLRKLQIAGAFVVLGGAALSEGCIEVAAPKAKDALSVRDLKAPDGATLETACTPSGVELCFDARDNNCNGVIDEGCGVHTGILQFTVAWNEENADVDLNVYDPNGDLAQRSQQTTAGLLKDRDCPRQVECGGQNVENVYLVDGDPKGGRYRVVVRLDKLNGAEPPVRVTLSARVGQRMFSMKVDLSPGAGTDEKSFEFTI
jgi:hypothetical protein